MDKLCPKCELTLDVALFAKNKAKPDGLGSWCKQCSNVLIRKWQSDAGNKARHKAALYKRRVNNKARLMEHFNNQCCDCGQSYPPYVYDFHHLDPSKKDYSFGAISTNSWAVIEKEILGKCVMLCSNCHRIRHHAG